MLWINLKSDVKKKQKKKKQFNTSKREHSRHLARDQKSWVRCSMLDKTNRLSLAVDLGMLGFMQLQGTPNMTGDIRSVSTKPGDNG